MSKKKRPTWEQSSQVRDIMESNKPIKLKEQAPYNKWEKCVQDYFERDRKRWEARNKK